MAESTDLACHWGGCSEQYNDAETLFEHVCEVHVGYKAKGTLCLTCHWNDCGKVTSKRDNITSHIRCHIPLRSFACAFCEKKFKRGVDLKKHVKTHENGNALDGNADAQLQKESTQKTPGRRKSTAGNNTTPASTGRSRRAAAQNKATQEDENTSQIQPTSARRGRGARQAAAKAEEVISANNGEDYQVQQEQVDALIAAATAGGGAAEGEDSTAAKRRRQPRKSTVAFPTETTQPPTTIATPYPPPSSYAPQAPMAPVAPLAPVAPVLTPQSPHIPQSYTPPTPAVEPHYQNLVHHGPLMPLDDALAAARAAAAANRVDSSDSRSSVQDIAERSKKVVQEMGRDVADLILATPTPELDAVVMSQKLAQLGKTTTVATNIIDEIVSTFSQYSHVPETLPRSLAVNGIERIMNILLTVIDSYNTREDKAWDSLRARLEDTKKAILSSFIAISALLPSQPGSAEATPEPSKARKRKSVGAVEAEEKPQRGKRRRQTVGAGEANST